MSISEEIKMKCPSCGADQQVTVWRSVDASGDPGVRAALFAWEINVFVCSQCDVRALLPIELLYIDQEKGFSVQYYPVDSLGSDDFYDNFGQDGEPRKVAVHKDDNGKLIKPHIVFDMSEMMRYIAFREIAFKKGKPGKKP